MREHLEQKKAEEAQRHEEEMARFRKDLEASGSVPTPEEVTQMKSFLDMMS